MRSTDHGGRGGGPHGPSRETISARPNDSVDRDTDGDTMPGCAVLGPFSFLDHHAMGLFYGEYAYFYRVPTEFDETATAEINGVRNGTASSFGPFEVPTDPETDEFRRVRRAGVRRVHRPGIPPARRHVRGIHLPAG